MKQGRLILMRHGESVYNQKNLFTGWTDVELSDQGIREAEEAGEKLLHHQLYPDICFTSWLKRAIHTAQHALKVLKWEHIDAIRSFALNERHYGAWQGEDKDAVRETYGETLFLAVRRGYDNPPPPLSPDDRRNPAKEKKYSQISPALLPASESLKMTRERVIPYYKKEILPKLQEGKTVLVSAHGNSLRALVMYLEDISEAKISELEIPTGEILLYTLDRKNSIVEKKTL